MSQQEQAVLAQATSFSVPFGSVDIQTFYWGAGPTVLLVRDNSPAKRSTVLAGDSNVHKLEFLLH
jgi:hypothetical protein